MLFLLTLLWQPIENKQSTMRAESRTRLPAMSCRRKSLEMCGHRPMQSAAFDRINPTARALLTLSHQGRTERDALK
jgi:hypothetical protein